MAGSLASTVQARDLLSIAGELRIPKLVLVGDAKQLDAVDAGKPFAQLQQAGMKTAVMDEIMRQRDPGLKAAVEASLAGDIGKAFEKLGANVAEVNPKNIAGAVAARWLGLSPEERGRTGVMAPSPKLRGGINAHIRERLAREGRIAGRPCTPSGWSPGATPTPRRRLRRTTPPATWSRSTARTNASGSRRETNAVSSASITASGHPHLTTRKTFYVEISRARHGAGRSASGWSPSPESGSRLWKPWSRPWTSLRRRKAPGTRAWRSERKERTRRPMPIPAGTMRGKRRRRRNGNRNRNRRRSLSADSRWNCSANRQSGIDVHSTNPIGRQPSLSRNDRQRRKPVELGRRQTDHGNPKATVAA